jgi:prepilin-type N-terminal cleavage/methylation domain-containing protein
MRGFSLLELLLAMLIGTVVVGTLFQLLDSAQALFQPQLEAADLQQRMRVAVDVVAREVMMAGAGRTAGTDAGPLSVSVAPVMPYRRGLAGDDPASGVFYRPDTITVLYVASSAAPDPVVSRTYYLRSDAETDAFQLMQYDGDSGDFPLVDNVVALAFEYFGEAQPPVSMPPPEIDTDLDPSDEYPAGENCLFTRVDEAAVPRLPSLAPAAQWVFLTEGVLTDGPWCPNALSANRFDADLLRIRRVRVRLRLQVGQAAFRGPSGPLFTRGGFATVATRLVPDREIAFDVTPPNLAIRR